MKKVPIFKGYLIKKNYHYKDCNDSFLFYDTY